MKKINLNAIGGYLIMNDFVRFLDRIIKKPYSIKELKEIRNEKKKYLSHLKKERTETLRFLKKKK